MNTQINYGQLMHQAMRGLMIELLTQISETGLPGEHHFFITFDTEHPDVEIADWLHERYEGEMTVVMQHWFENLIVEEDHFEVTLNFGDAAERLVIPWEAIKTFVDPSVEFGLRFEAEDKDEVTLEEVTESPMADIPIEEHIEPSPKEAEVVSLDSFRKPD